VWGRILARALLVMLVSLMACSGVGGRTHEPLEASGPVVAPKMASPCEIAAGLRARVPKLMEEGKLHRTGRVIEKANRLCLETAKQTWAAEVEVLAELGEYAKARELGQWIGAAAEVPEVAKQAAKAAAEKVKRFDKAWPGPEAATEEMRKAYTVAEEAEAEGKRAEAMALYERAWEVWPLNGQALANAAADAKALGKPADRQRLLDRAIAVLEKRAESRLMLDVPNGFDDVISCLVGGR
jgi:tetratricopeptide (TPR) repeat protein